MKNRFNFANLPLVQWAAGTVGFHNEGYWYHYLLRFIPGFTKKGITNVMKTVTLNERKGKTPLNRKTFSPVEWFPNSIWVNWLWGSPVNAVGLTNFGIKAHYEKGDWLKQKEPFYISIMAVGEEGKENITTKEKIQEIEKMVYFILKNLHTMPMLAGVQINLSCGNTGHNQKLDLTEVLRSLDACIPLYEAGLHVIPKIIADEPVEAFLKISDHPAVTAIAFSNAIQYDKFTFYEKVQNGFFTGYGDDLSIKKSKLLNKVGLAGSVSGKMLFPKVLAKLQKLSPYKNNLKPFIVGGGIVSVRNLKLILPYLRRGDKIALGSVIFLRPWRIKAIKNYFEYQFPNKIGFPN